MDGNFARRLDEIVRTSSLPIHTHILGAEEERVNQRFGARTPTLVLVRPDGYIGFRGSAARLGELRDYLGRIYAAPLDRAEPSQRANTIE